MKKFLVYSFLFLMSTLSFASELPGECRVDFIHGRLATYYRVYKIEPSLVQTPFGDHARKKVFCSGSTRNGFEVCIWSLRVHGECETVNFSEAEAKYLD